MREEVNDEGRLRKYLLGELNEAEQQALEERLLSDDELFDLLHVAEDELIDDYVGGALSTGEGSRFDSFFLSTPDRRRKLSFAMALRRYVTTETAVAEPAVAEPLPRVLAHPSPVVGHPSSWWKQAFSSPYLRMAAAAVIVLSLGLGIWRVFFYQSEVAKGMAALARAYNAQRPVEARISGLGYAALANTRGSEPGKVDNVSLNRAERILLDEAAEHPGPSSHHALGELYLAERRFDDAIKQFEEALKEDARNAKLHSDLGAALLEKGKADRLTDDSGKGLEELAKSLEHLNKALELDSSLLEARFNRALVHQEMVLPQQAEEDWRKYLEKDPSSKWADEARENLRLIEEDRKKTSRANETRLQDFLRAYELHDDEEAWQIISRSREALSRQLIWEQLLDACLESSIRGRHGDAKTKLEALSYEGQLEFQRAGDPYTLGLAAFYNSSSDKQRESLNLARGLMKGGHEYYFQHRLDDAIDVYNRARQSFSKLGDEQEAQYAEHWIGYCHYEQGKTEQSISILERLARSFDTQSYKWLLMRTLHLLSSAYHNLNDYSKALNYNHRALSIAEQMADAIGIFNASSILVFQYSSTSNNRQALACAQKSLSMMDRCPLNEIQVARHYTILALAFSAAELYAAAIDYQKEALRRALAIGHIQHTSLDYARLGLMYGKSGNFAEALRNLDLAKKSAELHPDETLRKEMMAFSFLQMGHLYRERGDIGKAIGSYDESISLSDHFHFQYNVYEARKNRLFCYLAMGNDASAGEELQTTLNLAERYRSTILEGDNRNSFFDIEQDVYDLAIEFAYSRLKDPQKAFEYSEESRSRSLLDSVTGDAKISNENQDPDITFKSVSRPLTLAEIQARLPEQAQILQYAILDDKILIWVISKTQFSTVEKQVPQRDLSKKVMDFLQFVSKPVVDGTSNEIDSSAKELFDILIKPTEQLLDRNKPVYVVPDKVLNTLPFGALVSSASGRILLEDYLLQFSPSSSLLVICSEMASTKGGSKMERLLSVGNPRFDRSDFPALSDLPSAGREAQQIATCYRSSRLLVGELATREQVKSEMPISDIIHLALHSVVDDRSPMRSKLVLAKPSSSYDRDSTSDGALLASDIYRLKLPRTRLVVLSACQTGAERYYRGEGMISMARPFIAATVPLVVVSLWPVDSASTAELMISFHKHRKRENASTVEALRRAQLDMLNSSNERLRHPYCWASFIAIGGYANF